MLRSAPPPHRVLDTGTLTRDTRARRSRAHTRLSNEGGGTTEARWPSQKLGGLEHSRPTLRYDELSRKNREQFRKQVVQEMTSDKKRRTAHLRGTTSMLNQQS